MEQKENRVFWLGYDADCRIYRYKCNLFDP